MFVNKVWRDGMVDTIQVRKIFLSLQQDSLDKKSYLMFSTIYIFYKFALTLIVFPFQGHNIWPNIQRCLYLQVAQILFQWSPTLNSVFLTKEHEIVC